ncbi:MAG: PAS domain S-box protein [Proteobacteria bacterium]|nr:PAS domain S-box protein [Pseudomonadota bacterium]
MPGLPADPRQRPGRYTVAVGLIFIALALRLALNGLLPPTGFPFLTFFPAVAIAALYGGFWPGLVNIALSVAAAKYFFVPEIGSFAPDSWHDVVALTFFAGIELLEVAIIHLMHLAVERARQAQAQSATLTEALRRQERTLGAVLDSTTDSVVALDGAARVTYLNQRAMAQLALGANPDGAVIWDVVPGLRATPFGTACAACLEQRTPQEAEAWFEPLNRLLALRAFPGEDGGITVYFRDVTETRQTQQRLADLVATLDLGVAFVRALDGTIQHWSAGCEQLYGWSGAEAVGRNAHDLLQTVFPQPLAAIEAALERDGRWSGELVHRARDGRRLVLAARKVLRQATDGRPPVILEALTDVTAERQARVALAESEAQLRTIVETVPVGLVLAELPSGRIVGGNSYVETLVRHPVLHSPDIHSYDEWVSYHADGTRVAGHEYPLARMVLAGEEAPSIEVHYQRGDGTRAWTRIMGRAVRDAEGALVGGVVALVDVNGERAAREALAESEARFRATFEQAAVGMALVGLDGRWLMVNGRLVEMVGYTQEELLALRFQDITHPADLDADLEQVQRLLAGEIPTYTMEKRYVRKDGTQLWVDLTVAVQSDANGAPRHFISVIQDISARKATEAVAADYAERLRLALEAGQMGYWSWDLAADRLEWDARQFELFGLDPAVGQPQGAEALACVHPDDRPALDAAIEAALATGAGVFSHEFRVRLPGGRQRWIGGHGRAIPGPDGKAARMVGLNFDVTERREAAAVLEREAADLERLADQRAEALAETEARLERAAKMEALGRLAGGVAHDFNNVLQAVQGGIALADKRLGPDPQPARRFLTIAADAAQRGAAVTGRLLAFARRSELSAAPVQPAGLLDSLAPLLQHTLGPSVRLSVQAPPDLPSMLADAGQLEAVLVNLANNARDALPGGCGTISLRADAVSVVAGDRDVPDTLAPGQYVRMTVTDDGVGMKPDVLARVTEPFFTTKATGKGTGLGLAMARGFAEQSGGALAIRSTVGVGTAVTLWLPQAPHATADEADAGGDTDTTPGLRAAVLLVDDEPGVRAVMSEALSDRGHQVAEAADGAMALSWLDAGVAADVLVTDLAMPGGIDGLTLVREARRRRPNLPAVLITGHAGEASPEALRAAVGTGPFSLMRKPASVDAVEAQIALLLQSTT